MRAIFAGILLAGLLAGLLGHTGGCRREAPVNGIAGFEIGNTQLKDACPLPTNQGTLTWCPGVGRVPLDGHSADIDLYYGGKTGAAKLVEILLTVPGCRPDELANWLTAKLGPPTEQTQKRRFWSNDYVFIAAILPSGPSRCEISFVDVGDSKRIQALRQEATQKAKAGAKTDTETGAKTVPKADSQPASQ